MSPLSEVTENPLFVNRPTKRKRYGIEKTYAHLNPGQQRMTIGIMLRNLVRENEFQPNA